jgi:hypothetical protein
MLEFLPEDVRLGFERARQREDRRNARLRLQVGSAVFPIRRFWSDGFALDANLAPRLRGLVDVYAGSRHAFQCLIVASSVEEGELICGFKRLTPVTGRAPLDFWQREEPPAGYLPPA